MPNLIVAFTIVVPLHSNDVLHLDAMLEFGYSGQLVLFLLLDDAWRRQIRRRMYSILGQSFLELLLDVLVYDECFIVLEDICGVILAENREHHVKLLPVLLLRPWTRRFHLSDHLLIVHRAHLVEW